MLIEKPAGERAHDGRRHPATRHHGRRLQQDLERHNLRFQSLRGGFGESAGNSRDEHHSIKEQQFGLADVARLHHCKGARGNHERCQRDPQNLPPIAPIGNVTSVKRDRHGRDHFDQSEHPQRQGIPGQLVNFVAQDDGQCSAGERRTESGRKEAAKVGKSERSPRAGPGLVYGISGQASAPAVLPGR